MFVEDDEMLFFSFLNCPGETFPVKIREMEIFHTQGNNWDVILIRKKKSYHFLQVKELTIFILTEV